ncbi:MAG: HAMP domain-containing sensor histidine kinase [bacterium]|nr:HAMP domain-containing sensor histidine kinase [bacterium]
MPRKSSFTQSADRLYISKATIFKLFLLIGIAAISAVFVWYTFNVIDKLKEDTRSQVEKYVKMWQLAANSPTSGQELQFIFDEIIVKATFPIVVLDENRDPIHWRNIADVSMEDTTAATLAHLREVSEEMFEDHGEFPLVFGDETFSYSNYFRYGDSAVIRQLKMMPFIEIGILFAFLILAFIGFQNIRQSEERHIWVGMAKETAHQLGTPISSLMGWLEVIEADRDDAQGGCMEIDQTTVDNMRSDITRLQRVANRFGLIGSVPEMEACDLKQLIEEIVEYYCRRLPFEGKGQKLIYEAAETPPVLLNAELAGWVFENLIKNALQAVDSRDGRVTIHSSLAADSNSVRVEIADNGKGIPVAAQRKIFRPGFTTKKRGWGMGLTLVKRIVEEYHGGRIYLKRSKPGDTVFEMHLPLVENRKGS